MTKHSQPREKKDLVGITYTYLVNNFHKFTQNTKIRVALQIQSRVLAEKPKEGDNHYHVYNDFRTNARKLGADGIRHLMRDIRAGVSKV